MNASDIYGASGMGMAPTQEKLNATAQTATEKGTAQATATNQSSLKNSYSTIALLSLFGILIGFKFGFEKRGE